MSLVSSIEMAEGVTDREPAPAKSSLALDGLRGRFDLAAAAADKLATVPLVCFSSLIFFFDRF